MFTEAATDRNWKNTFAAEIKRVSTRGWDVHSTVMCSRCVKSPEISLFFHLLCWVYDFRKGDHPLGSTFANPKFPWMFKGVSQSCSPSRYQGEARWVKAHCFSSVWLAFSASYTQSGAAEREQSLFPTRKSLFMRQHSCKSLIPPTINIRLVGLNQKTA